MLTKTILRIFLFGTIFTYAQVGIGTTTPDAGSILEINSPDKGILIPRVALSATNSQLPITPAAIEGMMVYNTATAGTSPNIVTPGFYFWDGTLWIKVATGGTVTKDWTVTGNGDNLPTDVLGTTNNQDLVIVTNNSERIRVAANGNVGIGTIASTAKLEIDITLETIPPLEIVPSTTVPVGTANGQIMVMGNTLYMYDMTRNKWLSSETLALSYSRKDAVKNLYLLSGGDEGSANSGPRMPFNGTIVAITAQSSGGTATKSFQIRKNGLVSALFTFNLTTNTYTNTTTNIDFNAGDFLNVFVVETGNDVFDPSVLLLIKWRK